MSLVLRCNIVCVVAVAMVLVLFSCTDPDPKAPYDGIGITHYEDVIARDTLIVVTATNSTDYFVYRGNPMGFQLDLLRDYAEYLGVELKVIVENSMERSIALMLSGQCDMIAQRRLSGMYRLSLITYSDALADAQLVLVQRRGSRPAERFCDLGGDTLFVARSAGIANYLQRIAGEEGCNIYICEIDSLDTEQMMAAVADGQIQATVVDENIAVLYSNYYHNLYISEYLGEPLHISWALPRYSTRMLDTVNAWIELRSNDRIIEKTYSRYFRHRYGENGIDYSEYINNKDRISPFDDLIKLYATRLGWDWRLLASLIYQESHFDPNAVSWAGAIGIMQLMPQTAARFGIDSTSDVGDHIAAGVDYLKYLDQNIPESVCDSADRIKMVLAAYNMGFSHVNDAIALAHKYGRNHDVWDNHVEDFMMRLSDPRFYTDSVVSSGYCPGKLAVAFVDEIFERYRHYCNIVEQ